jgi:hypothetical protein
MMQTFLPYPNIWASAKCLDNKRLGKQRVECKQILIALGVDVGPHRGNSESRWRNHPAVRMWRGHELCLAEYAEIMCAVWLKRGFRDSLKPQFQEAALRLNETKLGSRRFFFTSPGTSPNWLGYDRLHASHRSNLLRKDRQHYGQFGWQETPDLPYWWPVDKEVTA